MKDVFPEKVTCHNHDTPAEVLNDVLGEIDVMEGERSEGEGYEHPMYLELDKISDRVKAATDAIYDAYKELGVAGRHLRKYRDSNLAALKDYEDRTNVEGDLVYVIEMIENTLEGE